LRWFGHLKSSPLGGGAERSEAEGPSHTGFLPPPTRLQRTTSPKGGGFLKLASVLSASFFAVAALAGCKVQKVDTDRAASARAFPQAYRPVSAVKGSGFSTEAERDSLNEAQKVMDLAALPI
jgi:hypothetical protein